MDAFSDDEPSGGGAGEHRGLAAFDKASSGAPARAPKGSSRWSGGGPVSEPPKKPDAKPKFSRDDLDAELRQAHASHKESVSEDEMVAVSGSDWSDQFAQPEPQPRGRRGKPQPVEVDEGEVAEEPKKKSGAWKWVLGGVLLLGAGGAAAWGIAASRKGPGADADAGGSDAHLAASTKHEGDKGEADKGESDKGESDKKVAAAGAEAEADAGAEAADKGGEADAGAGAQAGAGAAGGEAGKGAEADAGATPGGRPDAVAEEAPKGPADWAPAAEAKNAWVTVPAAPEGRRLGLRDDEVGDTLTHARTGFRPAAKLMAPTKAYRIQSHEVTWGELEVAKSIPELALFDRPRWLPNNAQKLAALPATRVPWALARAFCRGLGGDLPSEAEWEWAARGADDRYFPWGRDAVDSNDCHIFAKGAAPVVAAGVSTLDKTPDPAIYDLLGNAQEWTRDAWVAADPADPAAAGDPKAATHKAVRGWPLGDAGGHVPAEGTTYRAPACADPGCLEAEAKTLERIGFRCIAPAP